MKSYSHDEMKKLFDASFVMLKEGEIVKATSSESWFKGRRFSTD